MTAGRLLACLARRRRDSVGAGPHLLLQVCTQLWLQSLPWGAEQQGAPSPPAPPAVRLCLVVTMEDSAAYYRLPPGDRVLERSKMAMLHVGCAEVLWVPKGEEPARTALKNIEFPKYWKAGLTPLPSTIEVEGVG